MGDRSRRWVVSAREGRLRVQAPPASPLLRRRDGGVALMVPPHGESRVFMAKAAPDVWAVGSHVMDTAAALPQRPDRDPPALEPGTVVVATPDGQIRIHSGNPAFARRVERADCHLDQATTWLHHGLRARCTAITAAGRPARLLLSGGVDSGLLASYLREAGADRPALTLRTPWGDEVAAATRTARHVGLPLEIVDVSAEQIVSAIPTCMRLLQSCDAEAVAIHVLVTVAYGLACDDGSDLITGLGSDLLNAHSEVGMSVVGEDIENRICEASASGLMMTDESAGRSRIWHPYWCPELIQLQLAVPPQLKKVDGIDKYYVRRLASDRLPHETAYGTKVAIHEGSGLVAGLESVLEETLSTFCRREWATLAEEFKRADKHRPSEEGALW